MLCFLLVFENLESAGGRMCQSQKAVGFIGVKSPLLLAAGERAEGQGQGACGFLPIDSERFEDALEGAVGQTSANKFD